jgi:hypothetical protein
MLGASLKCEKKGKQGSLRKGIRHIVSVVVNAGRKEVCRLMTPEEK